ncbi:MAG: hypothetical protein KAT34_13175 [Candidatus Aminicenantes bacterium]|nr:hypothetical protein [Candidatus Aminicenantes bacterium]
MIVYFDTVRRKRPVKKGGELIQLDWSTKRIKKKVRLFPTDPTVKYDPNPRGNSRGGKGILVTADEVYVGTYHTILVFDHNMKLKRRITNNLFVNIHEMCFSGENIWVSSAAIDCAVMVNMTGGTVKTWWPGEEGALQKRFGLTSAAIDKEADNRVKHIHAEPGTKDGHTHLNGIMKSETGTYVLLNRLGVVVRIEPGVQIILEDSLIKGGHSPVVSADGEQLILCSSFNKCILFYDIKSGQLVKKIDLLDFKEVADLHKKHPDQPYNKSIFVRGLELIDKNRFLVGISPASILEIDISREKLLDFYQYSADVGDAVHGLAHRREPTE